MWSAVNLVKSFDFTYLDVQGAYYKANVSCKSNKYVDHDPL